VIVAQTERDEYIRGWHDYDGDVGFHEGGRPSPKAEPLKATVASMMKQIHECALFIRCTQRKGFPVCIMCRVSALQPRN